MTMWASLKFYWPNMLSYLRRQVRTCNRCLAKIRKVNNHNTEYQRKSHGFPNKVLYLDLMGPLLEISQGDRFILTMQDGFSKYACAHPIPFKEGEVVANQLITSWLNKFGYPVTIHSNQGTEFENKIWHGLGDCLEIQKTNTLAYNPNSNLMARFHRTLN